MRVGGVCQFKVSDGSHRCVVRGLVISGKRSPVTGSGSWHSHWYSAVALTFLK